MLPRIPAGCHLSCRIISTGGDRRLTRRSWLDLAPTPVRYVSAEPQRAINSFKQIFHNLQRTLFWKEFISAGDSKSFWQIWNENHCLRPLLPTQRNNKVLNCHRNRGHSYLLLRVQSTLFRNGFIYSFYLVMFSVLYVLYIVCHFNNQLTAFVIVFADILCNVCIWHKLIIGYLLTYLLFQLNEGLLYCCTV